MRSLRYGGLIVSLVSCLILAGCGGGGGGGGGGDDNDNDNGSSTSAPTSSLTASAGRDQHVKTGDRVTLDGRNSSASGSSKFVYHWSFVSRPDGSSASLSSESAAAPTFTPDVDGNYVVSLYIASGDSQSKADTVTVISTAEGTNAVPVANAGPDQTVGLGKPVQLDGTRSSDADGDSLTYQWSFSSLPKVSRPPFSDKTAAKPTFVPRVAGTYVVALRVSDGKATSAIDKVTIVAGENNIAPTANAGKDQNVLTGAGVQLDGSSSSDKNNDKLTYAWSIKSRPDGSNATLSSTTSVKPTFTADFDGNYVIQLVVNDGQTSSKADTVMVTADMANSAPVADAGPDQHVKNGIVVNLDGAGSRDPDGSKLSYSWTFKSMPDGSTSSLANDSSRTPSFTPDIDGDYVVQLIVSDGKLKSQPDTLTVTSSAPGTNSVPVANAGPDQDVAASDQATLDGSASSDADGDTLSYAWTTVSRPSGSTAVLSDPAAAMPTFTPDRTGDYVFQLTVNDGQATSDPDMVTITAGPVLALSVDLSTSGNGTGYRRVPNNEAAEISVPAGSSVALLNRFKLKAVGDSFTVNNLSVTASAVTNGPTPPASFTGVFANLGNDQTIDEGDTVTFTTNAKNVPTSSGDQYRLVFRFQSASGAKFSFNYLVDIK